MRFVTSGCTCFLNSLRSFLAVSSISVLFMSYASAQNLMSNTRVSADAPITSPAARYPSGSIRSAEAADQALAEVDRERARIEAEFSDEERACYPRFFTTSCLNMATEQRRHALVQLRSIEVEANAFKRRARVADLDRALAEKQAAEETERAKRATDRKDGAIATTKKSVGNAQGPGSASTDRNKEHQARLQRLQMEESANAQKRAENVAAYEKKLRQAEQRQREIAVRKAEKERERQRKEAAVPAKP